jgi:glutathione S-transferase
MMQASTKVEIARQSAGWGDVALVMDVLEDRLSKANPYLLGDWFTAADVLIGGALGWATQFGMFEMRPGFENYLKAVQSRPAFQKVFGGQE